MMEIDVEFIRGDFTTPEIQQLVNNKVNSPFDYIFCDLAPKFSGNHQLDHTRQVIVFFLFSYS